MSQQDFDEKRPTAQKNGQAIEQPSAPDLLQEQLESLGLLLRDDGCVHWRNDNVSHPRNWSKQRKAYDASLFILLDFFTTAISSAGTSAGDQARLDLGTGRTFSLFAFTSIYLIGQAFGGVLFPPYSECFGRKKLYIVSMTCYSIFCLLPALVPHLAAILIARLCAGALSAIPTNVVGGSIEDMFNIRDRIWMIPAWLVVANFGLALGPIFGAYVTSALGWRWVFYIAAIITGTLSGLLLFTKESRPSQLLAKKVSQLRKITKDETIRFQNPDHAPDARTLVRLVLVRPLRMFFTEPIVFLVAILAAVAYGLVYLFTEAIPIVYGSFGFSPTESSLIFLGLCVGIFCSIFTRFYDYRVFADRWKRRQKFQPEDKLFGFAVGAPALAIGLWWFAWTIPPRVRNLHWIVSAVSMVLIGYSTTEFDCTLGGYVADSYTIFSASAFAAIAVLRALGCAAFPLFADQMFLRLGSNIAVSILATFATVFCLAPLIFHRYGKAIRERSPFATYSLQVYEQNEVDRLDWEDN